MSLFKRLVTLGPILYLAMPTLSIATQDAPDAWASWGQNLQNTHHNAQSTQLSKKKVPQLEPLCHVPYVRGQVNTVTQSTNAKPLIIDDTIYWTAMSGQVGAAKIKKSTAGNDVCQDLWVKDVKEILNLPYKTQPASRVTPAFFKTQEGKAALLYIGIASPLTLPQTPQVLLGTPMVAFALDATTGKKLWELQITEPGSKDETSVFASSLSSPTVYEGMAYFGLSSFNNFYHATYRMPLTFRGQMFAIDLHGTENKGKPFVKWRTYTLPKRPKNWEGSWFSGAGVWTSGPSILPNVGKDNKGLVFFGSGQLYDYPEFTQNCMSESLKVTTKNFVTKLKGETGLGAKQCFDTSVEQLTKMGIKEPLANNSIIALNVEDGSFAWHYPTAGIDAWQYPCGDDSDADKHGCELKVAGPDWDCGGSAPMLVELEGKTLLVGHNKGGSVYILDAISGQQQQSFDVCVGSGTGGIHFGVSYDPESKTLLVPCSGGLNHAFVSHEPFTSTLANGDKICQTGYLNAIDLKTGALKWQAVPARARVNDEQCPQKYRESDERFKYGLEYSFVHKNKLNPNVKVNRMPENPHIPLEEMGNASSHGVPSNAQGIVYWPVFHGTLYALDIKDGHYLHQMHCPHGALYGGPSIAQGRVAFGCGYGVFGGTPATGDTIMVYGLAN